MQLILPYCPEPNSVVCLDCGKLKSGNRPTDQHIGHKRCEEGFYLLLVLMPLSTCKLAVCTWACSSMEYTSHPSDYLQKCCALLS